MTNWYAVVRAGQQKYCFTKFHESFEDAEYEAERLAELENDKFYILKMGRKYKNLYCISHP